MYLDPRSISSADLYKLLIQVITPRPIAWISTVSRDGVPNLAPFSFSTGVGSNPPSHLFCPVNHSDGRKKDTLVNCETTGEYVVNVVPFALREAMNISSADFPAGVNEFAKAGLTAVPSANVRPARVGESPVQMECKILKIFSLATGPSAGNVVIGEIVAIHINDAVLRDGKIPPELLDTIGRMGGPEYCRTTERFTLPRPTM